jgi:hypothetical protein
MGKVIEQCREWDRSVPEHPTPSPQKPRFFKRRFSCKAFRINSLSNHPCVLIGKQDPRFSARKCSKTGQISLIWSRIRPKLPIGLLSLPPALPTHGGMKLCPVLPPLTC